MDAVHFWNQGDTLTRGVALVLLGMSVASWAIIAWKAWLLRHALREVRAGVEAFWLAPDLARAQQRLAQQDRLALLRPLLAAVAQAPADTLAAQVARSEQITRCLRGALQAALQPLQHGQVVLASVGATAPFVGLLGTVWGIYHALINLAGAQQVSIERVAAPVGEALIMTAAGLAVALPAVLAYNLLGRLALRVEVELEGFAHDLRALALATTA